MFSGGVDRLQSGSITAAELRRLLHCCGFHLQDDAFSALLEASGTGADKSVNLTNETLVNCQAFCSFLKQLLSDESHDAVAVTVKEVEHAPYARGLRSDNAERSKHQRVYHSSPARLMVKVEHTLRDAGWGSDAQFRRLDQVLAARDRERTGYLCTEDVSLSVMLHILMYRYTHQIRTSKVEPPCREHHWDPVGCPV